MVVSNVLGGLGNQMFQYAVARAISIEKNESVYLDISDFSDYKLHHGFELIRLFKASFAIISKDNLNLLFGWKASKYVRKILRHPFFSLVRPKSLVVEPSLNYWSGIQDVSNDIYLIGYWQSERYFEKHAAIIRSDFTFKAELSGKNIETAESISKSNAISLHIRRGDYVKNPETNARHGVCSLEYYFSAVRYIAERVQMPEFFIFSDDITWVRQNLTISYPCHYIDHNNGPESYNDMRLMSMCKHHIIANSTFSWWGAWLNPNLEKIVVAPNKWFASGMKVSDLIPSSWTTL